MTNTVHGQAPDPRELARAHFERGVDFAREGRWQDAIVALQAARDLRPTPSVYFNLGLACRAVGRNREAIGAFRDFLRVAGPEVERARVRQVEAYIQDLGVTMGRLVVRTEPAQAAVTVDGVPAPEAATGDDVDPGRHVVVAQADGYRAATRSVSVAPGARAELDLRLARYAEAGRLEVSCDDPRGMIRIDGSDVGLGRVEEYVPAGVHAVDVEAAGYVSYHREVRVVAGGAARVHASLARRRGLVASPWFWLGATAVAGALAAGAVLVFSSTEPPYEGRLGHVSNAVTEGP